MSNSLDGLIGAAITRVAFDYQVRFLISKIVDRIETISVELIIENVFYLRIDAIDYVITPGQVDTYAPTLRLLFNTIEAVMEPEENVLDLRLNSGGRMLIGADAQYESWHILGRGVPERLVGPGNGPLDWTKYW